MEEEPDSIRDMARQLRVVRSLQIRIGARQGEEQQDCSRALHLGVDPGAGPSGTSPWAINTVLTYLSVLAY